MNIWESRLVNCQHWNQIRQLETTLHTKVATGAQSTRQCECTVDLVYLGLREAVGPWSAAQFLYQVPVMNDSLGLHHLTSCLSSSALLETEIVERLACHHALPH